MRGDRFTNKCIFKQSIKKQKTGTPAKCRTRFMQWPVVSNLKTKLFYISLLLLVGISCADKSNKDVAILKSDFKLEADYTELTHKITELDTIKIWADLSSCMWMTTEKITLTKSNDSLNIELKVVQMMGPEVTEVIRIHKDDTIWNFNDFLKNNKDRLVKTEEMDEVNLRIEHNSDSIEFYTGNLGDLNKFIGDYYESMFKLKPKNKAYEFIMDINTESTPIKVKGIPESAFWAGNIEDDGHWFDVEWINNHKNLTRIAIYDELTGKLIKKKRFMKICPIDELKFIEDLRQEIDFYDGEKIQMKDNCYLQTN